MFAQHRAYSRTPGRRRNPSPDRERLLGSSRFRAAADRSSRQLMAALDQHRSRFTAGYRSLGSCSTSAFIHDAGGTAVGDRFVCRALRKPRRFRGWRRVARQRSRVRRVAGRRLEPRLSASKPICASDWPMPPNASLDCAAWSAPTVTVEVRADLSSKSRPKGIIVLDAHSSGRIQNGLRYDMAEITTSLICVPKTCPSQK